MNNAASTLDPIRWGDRTRLLPRAMAYALSLDFVAHSVGGQIRIPNAGPSPGADAPLNLRPLFDATLVKTADGATGDLPTGRVSWGNIELGGATGIPDSWLSFRLSIQLDLPSSSNRSIRGVVSPPTLVLEGNGVLNLDGGLEVLQSNAKNLHGSVFTTSTHQSSVAAYRWLDRRQLFGVGRVEGKRERSLEWELNFSLDLYTGA